MSQYLRHGVMVKYNKLLHKVIDLLCAMKNPFDPADKERLYNIATGKPASADTEKFLLSVNVTGEIVKKSFISECTKRPQRFEERIPKQKMQTFKTELGRKKFSDPMEKLLQPALCLTFLVVFCVFLKKKKIDMAEVLSCPLTPVSLSLSYSDGSMLSSPQSNLMKYLGTFAVSETPEVVHMFFCVFM